MSADRPGPLAGVRVLELAGIDRLIADGVVRQPESSH